MAEYKIECARCHHEFESDLPLTSGDVAVCDPCRDYVNKYSALRSAEEKLFG